MQVSRGKLRLQANRLGKRLLGVRPVPRLRVERAKIVALLRIAGLRGHGLFHAFKRRGALPVAASARAYEASTPAATGAAISGLMSPRAK